MRFYGIEMRLLPFHVFVAILSSEAIETDHIEAFSRVAQHPPG